MVTINAVKVEETGYVTDVLVDKKKASLSGAFREIEFAVKEGANQIEITITKGKYASYSSEIR